MVTLYRIQRIPRLSHRQPIVLLLVHLPGENLVCLEDKLHPKQRNSLQKLRGGSLIIMPPWCFLVTVTRMPLGLLFHASYCIWSPSRDNRGSVQVFLLAEPFYWSDCPNMAMCDWLPSKSFCQILRTKKRERNLLNHGRRSHMVKL